MMRPKLCLPPLILAAVLLALPASAAAKTKSQSTTLTASSQFASLTPKCPRGQRATGGGFAVSPPSISAVPYVYESQKVGQRSWRVSVQVQGSPPIHATAYVYCSEDAPKTKTRATTLTFSTGRVTVDAGCGKAGNAQAGGFLMSVPLSSGNIANLLDSYRADKKTWRTRAEHDVATPTVTTYAYCADAGSPKTRTGSTSASPAGALATALSAPCRRGTHVGAGGFSQPTATLALLFRFPWESFALGRSWRASAKHSGIAGSVTLNSIAYCA